MQLFTGLCVIQENLKMLVAKTKIICGAICFFALSLSSFAQGNTLSGYVKDSSTGESLIGATIYIKGTYTGTTSNEYGYYSLTLPANKYIVVFNYLGYDAYETMVDLGESQSLNIELNPLVSQIEEITIKAERENQNVVSTQMSNVTLSAKTIKQIPVLMGETDIIKTLQLLPGIKSTGGLSSGMSVRGGGRDHNLIMLDEAVVYNSGHLGGLFSVFNNDAIKNVEIYKGFIPAEHGGRLSSVLDIRMKDGNSKKFTANGGIGLISSRLTLEAPIVKDKASFLLSGRRTYMDAIISAYKTLSKDDRITEFPLHFYDLNAKVNYSLDQNNKLYLSGYFGRDVFSFSLNENATSEFNWGNYTGTIRWNHIFNQKMFSNFTLLASNYDYLLFSEFKVGREEKTFSFHYDAYIKDYGAKMDFGYFLNQNNTLKFGLSATYHDIKVGEVNGKQDTLNFKFKLPSIPGVENALYLRNEQKIGNKLALNYGLRYSMFYNPGNNDVNEVEDYIVDGSKEYSWDQTLYQGLEPRLGITYIIDQTQSVKTSYSRTRQYMLVASNSTSGSPIDVWISVNPNIKPMISDQVSLGYFRNFMDNVLETSIEVYYKESKNNVAFKEFAQPQFNEFMEEDLRFGIGKAYGLEILIKKQEGRLTGWVGYELSRSELKIRDIQEKKWFPSPYDSPHDITIVAMYELSARWSISANWLWRSGQPLNAPSMRYQYGGLILPYYPGRNRDRLPDYHRMDLGITLQQIFSASYTKWTDELVLSVYNVYFQRNPDLIDFSQTDEQFVTQATKYTFIPFFPSLTYNFKF
jgi:hypothetical protein